MSITFSPVVASQPRPIPGFTALHYLDLEALGVAHSPLAVLDEFRVNGLPFSPHPHAGFAAVTYVFDDSPGAVRSRASCGVDLVVGPGGIVWTEAASGVVHEETPAVTGRELHGLQLFVNRSSRNKLTPPEVFHLDAHDVPTWDSDAGDRVRVVVGEFKGATSPLVPVESFTFLDVRLRHEISFSPPAGHNTVIYVYAGSATVGTDGHTELLHSGSAIALHGGGHVTLDAVNPAHLLVLAGPEIREPAVAHGPFIMNDQAQIEAAALRYRTGAMGQLTPHRDR